jgi:hypothetical protein
VDPAHIPLDDPALHPLVRANRRALQTIVEQPRLFIDYIASFSGARQHSGAECSGERALLRGGKGRRRRCAARPSRPAEARLVQFGALRFGRKIQLKEKLAIVSQSRPTTNPLGCLVILHLTLFLQRRLTCRWPQRISPRPSALGPATISTESGFRAEGL